MLRKLHNVATQLKMSLELTTFSIFHLNIQLIDSLL